MHNGAANKNVTENVGSYSCHLGEQLLPNMGKLGEMFTSFLLRSWGRIWFRLVLLFRILHI
jgi:hypothetical protein